MKMKTTTKYLIGAVAVVIVIAVIAAVSMRNGGNVQNNSDEILPTFMYFVSKNDAKYNEAKAVYDELAAEYGDRVKFELKDVDENPELKDNFMINQEDSPIPMKTPTLIMLDVNNDISTIGLSECTDKATLKQAIEKALAA